MRKLENENLPTCILTTDSLQDELRMKEVGMTGNNYVTISGTEAADNIAFHFNKHACIYMYIYTHVHVRTFTHMYM